MDPISAALSLAAFAAPRLGRWLFGDDGETVATQMVSAARQITGTGTAEDAAAALRADPALLTQFQIQMATLESDLERAYLADRQSARLRDIELARAGRHNARADLMVAGGGAGPDQLYRGAGVLPHLGAGRGGGHPVHRRRDLRGLPEGRLRL